MKPILFSTPMVQAILDGRKTMTRRVVKYPPSFSRTDFNIHGYEWPVYGKHLFTWGRNINGAYFDGAIGVNQPYSVGDVMWVRETWGIGTRPDPNQGWVDGIEYKADEAFIDEIESLPLYHTDNEALFELYANDERKGWHPSIHMPFAAARLFLRVTSVRAERVQDMPEADAEQEGIRTECGPLTSCPSCNLNEFRKLWDSLYAKRGYGWDTNCWVWRIEFERCERPEE